MRQHLPGSKEWPVHPHVCGEHCTEYYRPNLSFGSSPRVWGTYLVADIKADHTRFIPTCVGNIDAGFSFFVLDAVHPHVCGEHTRVPHHNYPICGSSPRVWGTFRSTGENFICRRFIPTCVGNIVPLIFVSSTVPVHPHVCGEHFPLPG